MTNINDLNNRLRDADPLRHEAGLSPDTVAGLRRAVIAAAHAAPVSRVFWGRQVAMAACLAVMVLTGVLAARRVPSTIRDGADPLTASSSVQRTTQVRFSTPGGTRIIWTLDPEFQLTEARLRR
jgi:hypothetical protein